MAAAPVLPADLLHLIANELAERSDFATLYACVASSRHFGDCGAVAALYRICHTLLIKEESDGPSSSDQELPVQRLSTLWRSMILSTLKKTTHPYCRYIRSLNLGSLDALLRDYRFTGKISSTFFDGDLAPFRFVSAKKATRVAPLDYAKIVTIFGDRITQHAPLLEEVSDPMDTSVLSDRATIKQWAPRLVNVRSLEFWDGAVLADHSIREQLYISCAQLRTLRIYRCSNDDADSILGAFLHGLPKDSLYEFCNFRDCHLGTETCLALNDHAHSLTTLRLALSAEGVSALGLLQSCTAISTLAIECLVPAPDLKATQNDVYIEIVAWLQQCTQLVNVSLEEMISAPDLLMPILLNGQVSLERLEVKALKDASLYIAKDHQAFHQALAQQTSLRELLLAADCDGMTRSDVEILTDTLYSLPHLRQLRLSRISECLEDSDINAITPQLAHLEELVISSQSLTDSIWHNLAQLTNLNVLIFNGATCFTFSGIDDFIKNLGPGNFNIVLSISQDSEYPLEDRDLEKLQDALSTRCNGRLDYALSRDVNAQDYDSEDSD